MKSLVIPNSVTSIGYDAFYNCDKIKSVTIPSSVTHMEDNILHSCDALNDVTVCWETPLTGMHMDKLFISQITLHVPSGKVEAYSKVEPWSYFGTITDGQETYSRHFEVDGIAYNILSQEDKTVEVTYHKFVNNELSAKYSGDVVIPETVTYAGETYTVSAIGESAFRIVNRDGSAWSSNELKTVELPNTITSIGHYAFQLCSGLTSVNIPNSVTSIGDYAFDSCLGLASIILPNSVTSIGTGIFAGCSSLTSVTIGNSVTSIGWSAFSGCSGLTSITIPNSVTYLDGYAFQSCRSLKSVEIPSSVNNINWGCFSYCDSLSDVTVKWDNPSSVYYNSELFSNVDLSKATLHVPVGTKALYEAADVWKDFGTIVSNQTLRMNNSRVWAGEQKAIPVYLDNDVTISNVQFDLYLPDGIDLAAEEVEEGEEPEYLIERGGRMKSSHNLSCAKQDEGVYRIICYSTTNATLKDTDKSQPLMTLTLQIPNDIEAGNHGIVMKDVTLAHIDGGITTPYSTNRIEAILSIPHAYSLIVTSDDKTGNATISGKTYDSSSSLAEEGDTITLTANAMPRYRFSKWTDGKQELSTENPYTFILTSDKEITAEFVLDEHNIKFWADGQEFASTIQVRGDKLLVPSTNPTKVGYTFTGWEGVTEETVVPNSDAWYYAMFSPNPYTVTFRSEGNVVSSGIQYCDNWLQLPQAPTKVGYTFIGWEGVTSDTKVPACDVTYDAVFTINQYKVTFIANGQVVSETMQDYMSQITAPEAPEVANHVFITWGDVNTVPANDVTFTARYCLMGDIYEDGIVNITDLTELVNMIMTKDLADERKVKVADVYKDGIINITDLTSIVNIIMNKQYNVKGRETLSHNNIVGLSVDCNLLKSGTDGLMGINLENGEDEISNMQFDLVLPEGVTMTADDLVASIKATDRLTSNHMISACQNEDGSFRILIYSFQNATIKGTEGNVVNIAISTDGLMPDGEYDVDIYDVSLVRPTSVPVEYDYINGKMYIGQATGVNDIDIAGGSVENGKMYNTSGQPVGNGYKGIVISNGQKKYNK